eukprot:gb/GECG01010177.1/.p1 GENE.gb/GECG01010177.1/~~gb/GECG01010177.1/.p1  ORF type:complete len:166 (+),score=17.76 gb/GECG01010177.1/:1-498(+)
MPKFELLFKAEVEGLQTLEPQTDRVWSFDVRCSRCGETTQKPLQLDPREEMELQSGGGTVHMVAKCWNCRDKFSINLDKLGAFKLSEDDPEPKLQPVGTLDCRGCEPTKFYAGDDWTATAESGSTWENIALTEGEWADYDDKADVSTSIMNIETDVQLSKGGKKK